MTSLSKLSRSDRTLLAILALFLAAEVFGGLLRYYLNSIGLAWAVYIPKMLMVLALLAAIFASYLSGRVRTTLVLALLIVGLFAVVGASNLGSWQQPAFGIFVLVPLLFAICVEPSVSRLGTRLVPFVFLLWIAAGVGVIYDHFAELPWSGLAYAIGDVELTAARQWTTFGLERVAGLSRASYEVADQLLFMGLFLTILSNSRMKALSVWLLTGTLIALTTTKRTVGVYLVLTLLLPLVNSGLLFSSIKQLMVKVVPGLIVAIGIALPASTLFHKYSLGLDSYLSQFLLLSFEDRLTWMWPDGIQLVLDHGNAWLGRGVGGIGAAQFYFEPDLKNAADNLYLYLYATFGAVALVFLFFYLKQMARISVSSPWTRLVWMSAVCVLMSGWAVNGLEGSFSAMLLGFTWSYASRAGVGVSSRSSSRLQPSRPSLMDRSVR